MKTGLVKSFLSALNHACVRAEHTGEHQVVNFPHHAVREFLEAERQWVAGMPEYAWMRTWKGTKDGIRIEVLESYQLSKGIKS